MPHSTGERTSFLFGEDGFVIHFFKEKGSQFDMHGKVADLKNGNEIMFSLSAASKDEVDECQTIEAAGGTIFREAGEDENGYYWCGLPTLMAINLMCFSLKKKCDKTKNSRKLHPSHSKLYTPHSTLIPNS